MPEGFRIAAAYVQVKPDLEGFSDELRSKVSEATAGAGGSVQISLDASGLSADLDEIRAKIEELGEQRAEPSVGLDDAEFNAKIAEVHARLDELGARIIHPRVDLDTAAFRARLDDTWARLDRLGSWRTFTRIDLDAEAFNRRLDEARARLAAFRDETARARLGATGGSGGSGGGEGGGFGLPGGMFTGLLGLGTALAPGLGGAATGLGLAGGAGFLGLSGIAGALSAKRQADQAQSQGPTGAQQAATAFSNAVAIQQAQEQIGNAHSQAAQDAITSARSIEQAQQNLASVERSTAQSQVQALQQVTQAEQGVEEANYGLSEAQYNLNQAWELARENIAQLNDQLADSKLNVQSAQLAIQQAIRNQRQVNDNAYTTDLQRQQAALAVAQAQQHLKDAQDEQTASQYKADQANKAGVAGSQHVIQAKQALTQAQYAQSNAQQQYANAQTNLKNTEINNAQQIKAAQEQLSAAREQAAYQRMVDARNISDAEQNLTNTLKQQQLQAAATAAAQQKAANAFAQDMAKLTPAARRVVEQILGMSGAFKQMQKVAQNAIAPGVSVFLTGVSKLLPTLTTGIGRMGSVLGRTFASLGKAMQSPAGAKVFQGLIDNGIKFAQIVIPAVGRFAGALAAVGAKKGAVDGIANLIAGLADGLAAVVKAVSPFTGALSSVFTTVGKALAPIGALLGTVVGSLAKSLAPVLQALLPGVKTLADALGKGLSVALQALGPMLVPVGQAISAVAEAISPLLPALGQIIAQVARALTPVLQAVVPIIRQLAGLLVKDLQDGLLNVVTALLPVLPAVAKLITSLMPVISVVLNLTGVLVDLAAKILGPVAQGLAWLIKGILDLASNWRVAVAAIETAALWLWHNVFDPMWQGIKAGASWLYQNAILPLWHGIETVFSQIEGSVSWLWHHVFDPMWQGIESGGSNFLSIFKSIWTGLESVFKTPVSFIVNQVYNKGIVPLWDDVAGAFGADSLKIQPISGFARGGEVTGGKPGKDSVPALLTPGERVLSVPQVARLGGQKGIDALVGEAHPAYRGGVAHAAGGWSWNPLTDLSNIATDVGGIASSVWGGLKHAVLGGLQAAATPVVHGFEKLARSVLGTSGVSGLLDRGVNKAGDAILNFLGGKDASKKSSGGGSVGGTVPSGQHLSIIDAALAAAGVPPPGTKAQWEAGLNTLIGRESGWNPQAINLTDSNAAAGDPSRGLAQTIMSTFQAYHAPGTSWDIYDPVANVAAAARYIVRTYGNISNVQQANANLPPKGYDSGGWLMPGDMPVNGLRRPEAVLTPDQSEALIANADYLRAQRSAGSEPGASKQVNIYFTGTQYPTTEQMAALKREMALALGGG